MDGGRPRESLRVVVRHVHAVQSTGDRGCSGEDRFLQLEVIQSTPEGGIWCYCSPYSYVLSGVESTVQLALFVSVKVTIFHKTILFGDFSCL